MQAFLKCRSGQLTASVAFVASTILSSAALAALEQKTRRQFVQLDGVIASYPLVRGELTRAAVRMNIAPGYHINANPATYDYLIPTSIEVEGIEGISVQTIHYPEAKQWTFSFADAPLDVYQGAPVVGFELSTTPRTTLGEATLTVKVHYQACDDAACYGPTTAMLKLPVVVAVTGTSTTKTQSTLLEQARFTAKY